LNPILNLTLHRWSHQKASLPPDMLGFISWGELKLSNYLRKKRLDFDNPE
jgi:hypothetical protein